MVVGECLRVSVHECRLCSGDGVGGVLAYVPRTCAEVEATNSGFHCGCWAMLSPDMPVWLRASAAVTQLEWDEIREIILLCLVRGDADFAHGNGFLSGKELRGAKGCVSQNSLKMIGVEVLVRAGCERQWASRVDGCICFHFRSVYERKLSVVVSRPG
jgi:hypothetical protein